MMKKNNCFSMRLSCLNEFKKKNYSIVTPFELNDFLFEPWPRITLPLGANIKKETMSKIVNNQFWKECLCWKAKCEKWKKIVKISIQKVEMYKEKQNVKKFEKKEMNQTRCKKRFEKGSKSRKNPSYEKWSLIWLP